MPSLSHLIKVLNIRFRVHIRWGFPCQTDIEQYIRIRAQIRCPYQPRYMTYITKIKIEAAMSYLLSIQ